MRFKCFECDNYDLCYRCYIGKIETSNHKSSHQLLFTSSMNSKDGTCKSCVQAPLGTCKLCLLKISKTTSDPYMNEFRVIQNSIFTLGNAMSTYNMDHYDSSTSKKTYLDFMKIHFQNLQTLYKCDACNSSIFGMHFECYECENYDLCFKCYDREAVTQNHKINHRLLISEIHFDLNPANIKLIDNKKNTLNGIFKAIHTPTNKTIACKYISKQNSSVYPREYFKCCRLKSEFIVKQFGYFRENKENTITLSFAKEYMEKKDLFTLLQAENKILSFKNRLKMACNISSGLYDLHVRKIIHRNLTPAKIVVNSEYKAKISDLGIAEVNTDKESVLYMPKEFHSKNYNNKLDIYSFGLVLYFIFTGKRHEMMADTIYLPEEIPIFSELIHKCLNEVPSQRPDIKNIERSLNLHYSAILAGTQTVKGYTSFDREKREKLFIELYENVSQKLKEN